MKNESETEFHRVYKVCLTQELLKSGDLLRESGDVVIGSLRMEADRFELPLRADICFPLQADESQDVLHLNYTSWPDHGVPTVNAIESILQFVLIVRQQANRTKDPIIVHCRSGSDSGTVQKTKYKTQENFKDVNDEWDICPEGGAGRNVVSVRWPF